MTSAATPAGAYVGYEPAIDDVVASRVEPEEREQAVEAARRVAATLVRWQRVPSVRLQFAGRPHRRSLRPWDSSLRVASSRDCALWCDDVALRNLAESEGIVVFGTYALYEVLALEQGNDWLPSPTDMKMRLLRARIADVPISLPVLQEAADDRDGADSAVSLFLGRPISWGDLLATRAWYLNRVSALTAASLGREIPDLLFIASCGLGSAVLADQRQAALGDILAATLWAVWDTTKSPMLLTCSRLAARQVDPSANVDPLHDAVRHMLDLLENRLEADIAAQIVMSIFSQVEPSDELVVAALVLGDR